MWKSEEFVAKAKLFFGRASDHSGVDDEFTLWMLLGFEFLLRAPLAAVSPILLAQPDGPSALHAAGYSNPKWDPKSIPSHTVIERLKTVVSDYSEDRANDSIFLTGLRNAELHTSQATLANTRTEDWLPRWLRVCEILSASLGQPLNSIVSDEVIERATELAVAADRKLVVDVSKRVDACNQFFQKLSQAEIKTRQSIPTGLTSETVVVSCPSCRSDASLILDSGRFTGERIRDDEIYWDRVSVAQNLNCFVCGLTNSSRIPTARARSAMLSVT